MPDPITGTTTTPGTTTEPTQADTEAELAFDMAIGTAALSIANSMYIGQGHAVNLRSDMDSEE